MFCKPLKLAYRPYQRSIMKFTSALALTTAFTLSLFVSQASAQKSVPTKPAEPQAKAEASKQASPSVEAAPALNFTMQSIDGEEVKLSKYAGKVVVFVNVASKCGFTPQYEQLQALHEKYADDGLAIVGIPCNQFRGQEPGSDQEILSFCKENYGVDFDLMSKVDVNGSDQCELYKYLNSLDVKPRGKGEVKWNFEKYVLDRTGKPIARFASKVKPDSKTFVKEIEGALGETSGESKSYAAVSKKSGKTYYLFSKDVALKNSDKIQTLYYFAKDPNNANGTPVSKIPAGKVVSEMKNGVPMLKNDGSKKK